MAQPSLAPFEGDLQRQQTYSQGQKSDICHEVAVGAFGRINNNFVDVYESGNKPRRCTCEETIVSKAKQDTKGRVKKTENDLSAASKDDVSDKLKVDDWNQIGDLMADAD